MESIDIKLKPSSPVTMPPSECLGRSDKELFESAALRPCSVVSTRLASSIVMSRGETIMNSNPRTLGATVASVTQGSESTSTNESHECLEQSQDEDAPTCPICKRSFTEYRSLKTHMLLHSQRRWIPCSTCGKMVRATLLSRHQRIHQPKEFPCCQCSAIFGNKGALQSHMLVHSNERPCKCEICGKGFKKTSTLNMHYRIHKDTMFKCELCPSAFCRKASLMKHKELHAKGVDMHHCHECGKMFRNKRNLRTHLQWHTTEMPHACHLCPAKFTKRYHMELHILRHKGEKPYKCSICTETFMRPYDRRVHVRRVHSDVKHKDPPDMGVTPQTSSTETSRDTVIVDNEPRISDGALGEAPKKNASRMSSYHECDLCGRRFRTKENLQQHKTSHTGEKPYACSTCGQLFSQKYTLVRHHRIHTKELPYACELCPSKFHQKPSLERHIQQHASGVEFHHCLECHMFFKSRITLEKHQGWHNAGKPYPCQLCPRSFTRKRALDYHVLTHVPPHLREKPHVCPVCNKPFSWPKALQKHMRSMHSEDKSYAVSTDTTELIKLPSSLPSALSPVMESIDIKVEPCSPTTLLPPEQLEFSDTDQQLSSHISSP
uniref:C2H2-type domain-containing protein n=1 Tax=Rhipicephalus pulchellus TaxID=72859 RepID=L7M272_RHIPC